MDKVGSRAFYDAIAPTYESTLGRRSAFVRAVDAIARDQVLLNQRVRLLDVGTGNGSRLQAILNECRRAGICVSAFALEPSSGMSAQAQFVLRGVKLCSDWRQLDVEAPFDVALMLWNVLGHAEALDVLALIHSKLKARGRLVLDVNGRYNARAYGVHRALRNILRDMVRGTSTEPLPFPLTLDEYQTTVYLRTKGCITRELTQAGFRIVSIEYRDYETGVKRWTEFGGQIVVVAEKR